MKINKKLSLAFIFGLLALLLLTCNSSVLNSINFLDFNSQEHPIEGLKLSYEEKFEVNGSVVCNAPGSQTTPEICSDGEGGSIIIWDDTRSRNSDIYGQRINSTGDFIWGDNGTAICTSRNPTALQTISDGNGGAIVVWSDAYDGESAKVYAQKVNSTGHPQWNADGVLVSNASANIWDLRICSDEAGGVIACWDGDQLYQVYAQRINSTGDPVWTINGVAVAEDYEFKMLPRICSDGTGGAILVWRRGPNNYLYCQRINSAGDLQWGTTAMSVTSFPSYTQVFSDIVSDGAGGAYISWSQALTWTNIVVQHVSASGVRSWSLGKEVGTPYWNNYYAKMCSDGAGGVFVIWKDNAVQYIKAQRLKADGNLAWSSAAVDICKVSGSEYWYEINYDGFGGAFIVWSDDRSGGWDIYVQGISASGELWFEEDGKLVCNAINSQNSPEIVYDEEGGVFITWQDYRTGGWDVYAQYIEEENPTSNSPADITTHITSSVTINWTLYDDNAGDDYRVIANNTKGNFYVWRDWTSWSIGTPIIVPINRTMPGTFNYTIEYRDNIGNFGIPSTVIVTLQDDLPTSSHPGPVSTSASGSEVIWWTLYDDSGEGQCRVLANDTNGNFYVRRDWTSWTNNTPFQVTINRTAPGIFNYTVEYYDVYNHYGAPDTVIVSISDGIPSSAYPNDITIDINQSRTVDWTLTDDYEGGQFRVLVYNSTGDFSVVIDWTPWTKNQLIQVPIDSTVAGTFNYTIEYYDNANQYGTPDTVIVTIEDPYTPPEPEPSSPEIPLGDFYLVYTVLGILILLIVKKQKIISKN